MWNIKNLFKRRSPIERHQARVKKQVGKIMKRVESDPVFAALLSAHIISEATGGIIPPTIDHPTSDEIEEALSCIEEADDIEELWDEVDEVQGVSVSEADIMDPTVTIGDMIHDQMATSAAPAVADHYVGESRAEFLETKAARQ